MCLAIPGRIVEFSADQPMLAKVDVAGVRRAINIGLMTDERLEIGDWVLIHVGFAMSKVSEAGARDQLTMLAAMGEDRLAIEEVRGYSFGDAAGSSP